MADTAISLMQSAFELIKVYAPGEPVNSADSARAMDVMNTMFDEWSNSQLATYANLEQSFPLQPNVQQYTIGPGGTVNATRPLTIKTGPGAAYLMDSNQVRYAVSVVEQDQWNQIGLLNVTSQLPDTLFYDPQFPLGILNVFPLPLSAYTMYFDARLQLTDITTITQAVNLPPGYKAAIIPNLGIRLWPYYKQGDPPAFILGLAADTLATVKRTNIRQSPAVYDSAVVSRSKNASYNIFSDTQRGPY